MPFSFERRVESSPGGVVRSDMIGKSFLGKMDWFAGVFERKNCAQGGGRKTSLMYLGGNGLRRIAAFCLRNRVLPMLNVFLTWIEHKQVLGCAQGRVGFAQFRHRLCTAEDGFFRVFTMTCLVASVSTVLSCT